MPRTELDTSRLTAGDKHYTAYVGPPDHYDFMGATQFRLLTSLGLRASHRLLDFGCGSLRAGRFLLTYLDEGNYYGIEPNAWLVEEATKRELGQDLLNLKRARFDHNDRFDVDVFGKKFDWIVAQSIFSHTDEALTNRALGNFARALAPGGRAVVTFIEGEDFAGEGWIYPDCVSYQPETIVRFAGRAGLVATRLPWFHPRQTWYVMAADQSLLPTPEMKQFLRGAVIFDRELSVSWQQWRPRSLSARIGNALRVLRKR